MELINDIINELIDTKISISSPLLKTKVLASRLRNQELYTWVSNELGGYKKDEDLPKYRVHTGNIIGTYINGNKKYNNQPIPIQSFNEKIINILQTFNFNESISSLEYLVLNNKSKTLQKIFPAEFTATIQKKWRDMGNPFLELINCKVTISIVIVRQILSSVRNKLLDFLLKIDEQFGNFTKIEQLKPKHEEISKIMNTTINNYGDGNLINTGDKSKINATINVKKGDKNDLSKYLKENGVSEGDVAELIEIIDSEEPDNDNKKFGPKVNAWTTKLINKALDGSWNIGLEAAASLLAEGIGKFYGF